MSLALGKIRPLKESVAMAKKYLSQNWGDYVAFVERNFSDRWGGNFGHTFDRHFNMPDRELAWRVQSEKVNGASTFTISPDEVVSIIKEFLCDPVTAEEIQVWLCAEPGKPYPLIIPTDKIVGKCYLRHNHDWREGALGCDEILVSLAADWDYPQRFKIITAYPYVDGIDAPR